MEDERKADSNDGGLAEAALDASAAAPAPVIPRIKKVRKRGALKSSTTALDDDADDADAPAASADADESSTGAGAVADLQTIKLMQKLRSKSNAALALGEGALHLPDVASHSASASAAAAAASSSVTPAAPGKEFGAEGRDAQAVLIENQMEKYIAEKMAANRAARMPQQAAAAKAASAAAASAAPAVNLSEDQLFVTPAHLRIAPTALDLPEEESGERWLTGIAECSVSIRDKMRNIEQTEAAKQKLIAAAAAAARKDPSMLLPANYNSNFRLHKKTWDTARREEFRAFDDATNRAQALAAGLPAPPPTKPWAQDVPLPLTDTRALPGFLAGPGDDAGPRRDVRALIGGDKERAPGQRGSAVPNASDDRAVDRFIKRFKYK